MTDQALRLSRVRLHAVGASHFVDRTMPPASSSSSSSIAPLLRDSVQRGGSSSGFTSPNSVYATREFDYELRTTQCARIEQALRKLYTDHAERDDAYVHPFRCEQSAIDDSHTEMRISGFARVPHGQLAALLPRGADILVGDAYTCIVRVRHEHAWSVCTRVSLALALVAVACVAMYTWI
jgi:hypothetical protein